MNLSKQAIIEFQQIYKEEYGVDLSESEAGSKALRLLKLFKLIYEPIKFRDSKGML